MAVDQARIAQELARWVKTRPGVTDVELSLQPASPAVRGPRLPGPARRSAAPSFEIRMRYKGKQRVFRYFLEQADDPVAIMSTLRVHTNGELMIEVPGEYGPLLPNDIYYGNRSSFAPGLGDPAPNIRSRG